MSVSMSSHTMSEGNAQIVQPEHAMVYHDITTTNDGDHAIAVDYDNIYVTNVT